MMLMIAVHNRVKLVLPLLVNLSSQLAHDALLTKGDQLGSGGDDYDDCSI